MELELYKIYIKNITKIIKHANTLANKVHPQYSHRAANASPLMIHIIENNAACGLQYTSTAAKTTNQALD